MQNKNCDRNKLIHVEPAQHSMFSLNIVITNSRHLPFDTPVALSAAVQAFELSQNTVLPVDHLFRKLHIITDKGLVKPMLAAVIFAVSPINQSDCHRETGSNQNCQQFNVTDIVTPSPSSRRRLRCRRRGRNHTWGQDALVKQHVD